MHTYISAAVVTRNNRNEGQKLLAKSQFQLAFVPSCIRTYIKKVNSETITVLNMKTRKQQQ